MLQYHNCRVYFVVRFYLIPLISDKKAKSFYENFFTPNQTRPLFFFSQGPLREDCGNSGQYCCRALESRDPCHGRVRCLSLFAAVLVPLCRARERARTVLFSSSPWPRWSLFFHPRYHSESLKLICFSASKNLSSHALILVGVIWPSFSSCIPGSPMQWALAWPLTVKRNVFSLVESDLFFFLSPRCMIARTASLWNSATSR